MKSKYVKIAPGEQTDSNKYNIIFRNAANDIADLYSLTIKARSDVEAQSLIAPLQTAAYQSKLATLQLTLNSLLGNTGTVITLYDHTSIIYPSTIGAANKCAYQQMYGEATLPIASTAIEYHQIDPATGKASTIPGIERYISAFLTNNKFKPRVDELYENAAVNAISQSTNIAHITRARIRNVDTTTMTLVYNLELMQPHEINRITVHPLPEIFTSYDDITILSAANTPHKLVGTNGLPLEFPLAEARRRVFHFPPTMTNSISISIGTGTYTTIDNAGLKEFILGCALISVENTTYMNEGYIGMVIPVPPGKTKLGRVVPVFEGEPENIDVTVYESESAFNEITDTYLIAGNATNITYMLDRTLSSGTTAIYILFNMRKQQNNTTPSLKGCVVRWV